MRHFVGIDLGTTFSAVATINEDGKPEILPNREGERITPSVVLFDGAAPIVGTIAKQSAVGNALNVVQFVKRQMGNASWKFRTESGDTLTAEEISAIILKRLKEDAEAALGESVHDAVITVPAYFNDAQRKATQDAGRIAGLNVTRILNEPTAAALAYAFHNFQKSALRGPDATSGGSEDQTVLVYDLGGGTFDVTIIRLARGSAVEVVATGGDKNLGGFDWDNEIMRFMNDEFMKQGGCDLNDDAELTQQLREKAEIAKKTLSTRDKATVPLSARGMTRSVVLTREQFETLTAPLLNRTGSIMQFVLEDAGLEWSAISSVLLTGGSTRMRAVPALVERITGRKPSAELHPDEVVAMGAAIQAAMLAERPPSQKALPVATVSDVTSHSMGVVALDSRDKDQNSIVLPRNTAYGQEVSGDYATVVDGQRSILIQVTEGEDEDLSYVDVIIEKEVPIPPYPRGAGVRIAFQWNLDGIVHVSVFDMTAGKLIDNLNIPHKNTLSESQVIEKRVKLGRTTVN